MSDVPDDEAREFQGWVRRHPIRAARGQVPSDLAGTTDWDRWTRAHPWRAAVARFPADVLPPPTPRATSFASQHPVVAPLFIAMPASLVSALSVLGPGADARRAAIVGITVFVVFWLGGIAVCRFARRTWRRLEAQRQRLLDVGDQSRGPRNERNHCV